MTADESADTSAQPPAVEDIHAMPDPVLMGLVEAVARFEGEFGLTLHVSGVVVSGILVSASRFFELLADRLEQGGEQDFGESFAQPTADMFRMTPDGPALPGATNFIHLRAAQVFTSGSDKPLPETLWRGRLSHVSAWSFGKFSEG